MPYLAMEKAHLALADKHIAGAEERIAEATERAVLGHVTDVSSAIMVTMRATLEAYEMHRALILRTIKSLEDGGEAV